MKYILKRLAISAIVFFGITIIIYYLANLAPGSPADVMAAAAGENMTAADYEYLKHSLGLDKPVIVRYGKWLLGIMQGDLGLSSRTSQPVIEMIGTGIMPTAILMLTSFILALIISIPVGTLAAYKPYSIWDNISTVLAFFGTSTPNFFLALLVIYEFAVKLRLLPAQGMYDAGGPKSPASLIRHLILPAFVLAFQMMGSLIKQTRGNVLAVLNEDYVKTARAKGISEKRVVVFHALRNALIPIITLIGSMVPFLVGGAVVTEQIFGWKGIGSLMVQSINSRDYNTIMGVTSMIAIAVIITNMVLDILYSVLDPRIAAEKTE